MRKKFYLHPYRYYFESWWLLAAALFVLSVALLVWSPPALQPYRTVLVLSAGLGALVWVLGFAMHRLSFVAVGDRGVAVQLPLWRVRFPYTAIKVTRPTTLGALPTGKWDQDLAERSALLLELNAFPQPSPIMKFWMGKLVMRNAIALPVDDVIGLNRAVDKGMAALRETRLQTARRTA